MGEIYREEQARARDLAAALPHISPTSPQHLPNISRISPGARA